MGSKGQTTLFIITGIVLLLIIIIFLTIQNTQSNKTITSDNTYNTLENDAKKITTFIEECMRDSAFTGLFEIIAPQGGYIDPEYNEKYADYDEVPFEIFQNFKVAQWNEGLKDISPTIEEVERKLSKYIYVETTKCMEGLNDLTFSSNIDYIAPEISKFKNKENRKIASDNIEITTEFNSDNVYILFIFPIKINIKNDTKDIKTFSTTIPYNFKINFENAKKIVEETLASQPIMYQISKNCGIYDLNGATNIYTRNYNITSEKKSRIIQISDFEPFYNDHIHKALNFNFNLIDVSIQGHCTANSEINRRQLDDRIEEFKEIPLD